MNLDKMLKAVSNLNDYISVTQEIVNYSHNIIKIQFNMSSVLLLKKVRSLEIEYFNKCEGNGAALVLFERMVEQPASKTWGLLGKELVALLQYWLDAMRKHLIKHSHHWWTFLKLLLKFIKSMRVKDKSLPDILVEGTAECLLDLATSTEPDTAQRYEILYCFNLCCAESSREIRFALRNRFESYFTKLATLVTSCGHLPTQYSIVEVLLRWLLPRHEAAVRQEAASRWFPAAVYGKKAQQLFLERPWQNFFQDARDFLNAFNATANLVTSVLCREIIVGTVNLVTGTEKRETWLDLNSWDSSASFVLEPKLLDMLGVPNAPTWENLRVPVYDVAAIQLLRDASKVTLVIHTSNLLQLCPSDAIISDSCEVRVVISSATDLRHLDRALRNIFSHKYQVLLDLNKPASLSTKEKIENKKCNTSMEEDKRFSHPAEIKKRKRSGFLVRSNQPMAWKSPSTASTSSLAQLHEKLASLPQYKFDKEAVHVCALPELSTVTEVSETDVQQSLLNTSTFKNNRPCGVCHKNNKSSDRNSQSDGEVYNKPKFGRYLSPAAKEDENSTSCLLVATIGSADDSIINDTLERLTKNKDFQADNIVDLLVQEALNKDFNDKELRDSGINTGDNKKTQEPTETHSKAMEYTPIKNLNLNLVQNKVVGAKACTVISNTTTDESNDVVYETPINFVNVKKRNVKAKVSKQKLDEGQKFNVKEVEDFFSQHITENHSGEIVISPSLARKINESSSESENFEDCFTVHEDNNLNVEQIIVYDIDIIECLNSIVDKVCSDFEKCTELLKRDTTAIELISIADNIAIENSEKNVLLPLKHVSNIENKVPRGQTESAESTDNHKETATKATARKGIKLKFNTKRTATPRANPKKKKNKLQLELASNMSSNKEVNDSVVTLTTVKTPERPQKSPSNESVDLGLPLTRRKRKLYSPKDEGDNERVMQVTEIEDDIDFKTSKVQTPKYKATSYKDIEMDRKKRIRQPRRKSRAKSESSPSPRTKKKDDIFNRLKEKVDCPDPVIVVDKKALDLALYNFTSDSEDEDFKRKKNEVQKRISTTTIASGDSIMSKRRGRSMNRINYLETKSSDESNKKGAPIKKRINKRTKTQPKSRLTKPVTTLIDEKMRDGVPEELNTSLVVDKPSKDRPGEPKLILSANLQMEAIPDETITDVKEMNEKSKKITRKNKKTDALSLKKEKNDALINRLNIEKDNDDRTISPLPGLIVEKMLAPNNDANDSVSANMLQKFKKIYLDGPEAYINESNTDAERINYSSPSMNISDELNKASNYSKLSDVSNEITKVPLKSLKKKTNRREIVTDLSDNYDSKTKKTKTQRIKKEKTVEVKKNSKDETPEIINLIKILDDQSEVSIATVGKSPITAHGDFDEYPPNSELLTENIKPRDLDIEYMDQSIKDYFDKLRSEVNEIPSNGARKDSKGSDSTQVFNNDGRLTKNRSPVISVARLSLEDISKWLPSRRNSETDSNSSKSTPKEIKQQNRALNKCVKESSELTTDPVSDNECFPIHKIDKISLKFNNSEEITTKIHKSKPAYFKQKKNLNSREIADLLSNNDFDNTESFEEVKDKPDGKNSKKNKYVDLEDAKKITCLKWLRSRGNCIDTRRSNSHSVSPEREIRNSTPKKNKNVQPSQENRRSLISPINLNDDFKVVRNESSSNIKKLESIITNLEKEIKVDSDKLSLTHKTQRNDEVSSQVSKIETEVSHLKRKSKSPVIRNVKRRKVEDAVSISDSGPSVSSVNEWFKRNAPISRATASILNSLTRQHQQTTTPVSSNGVAIIFHEPKPIPKFYKMVVVADADGFLNENISASLRESIENVMEKLDTTLVEIHQNTSKKFIHMFVDAQKHLVNLKQERRNMYKSVASDILAQVVKVVDEKFAELDKRSQEMDAEFICQLKVQASALIREDCKKKQVMVSLLREDLTATLARIEKKGREATL